MHMCVCVHACMYILLPGLFGAFNCVVCVTGCPLVYIYTPSHPLQIYLEGDHNVEVDYKKALEYFTKAANLVSLLYGTHGMHTCICTRVDTYMNESSMCV